MRLVTALAVALALCGCKKSNAPEAPPPAQEPSGQLQSIRGSVLERVDAAGYSYLRLKTSTGEAWAAVMETEVTAGADVEIEIHTLMKDFESKALGRTFPAIYFGVLAGEGAKPAQGAGGSLDWAALLEKPKGDPHASAPAAKAPEVPLKPVEKAPGPSGHTVADVHAKRAQLAGKKVAVRGQVVKVSSGILGRNWLHLRDGSGSDAGKDNDLTVTTQVLAQVGEVVTAEGTVKTDYDVGAGYFYPVLLEEASLVSQQPAGTR